LLKDPWRGTSSTFGARHRSDTHFPGGSSALRPPPPGKAYTPNARATTLLKVASSISEQKKKTRPAEGPGRQAKLQWGTQKPGGRQNIHGIKPDRQTGFMIGADDWNTCRATRFRGRCCGALALPAKTTRWRHFAAPALRPTIGHVRGPAKKTKDYRSGADALPLSLGHKGTGALYRPGSGDWGTGAARGMSILSGSGPGWFQGLGQRASGHSPRAHHVAPRRADYLLKNSATTARNEHDAWTTPSGVSGKNSNTASLAVGGDRGGGT